MRMSIVALTIALCCGYACAETMYLDKDGTWKSVSSDKDSLYLSEIAKAKQLVTEGNTKEAAAALNGLKSTFPQLKDQGVDLFIEAELLFANRKFIKAAEKYTNFLDEHPGSDLYDAAVDRLYQIGNAFLHGQKKPLLSIFRVSAYEDGEKIMTAIADRLGDAPISKQALIAVATSYERRHSYRDAYRAWSDVHARWPAGEIGRDALYGMAVNMQSAYKGPKYESASLVSSRGYYVQLKSQYPEYAASIGVDKTLGRIDEQIAEKELTVARYYRKTGCVPGAEMYLGEVVAKWPNTLAADQARQMAASAK
jgi:outer membrane protein assembly factor BamD (BamD/ComL family)